MVWQGNGIVCGGACMLPCNAVYTAAGFTGKYVVEEVTSCLKEQPGLGYVGIQHECMLHTQLGNHAPWPCSRLNAVTQLEHRRLAVAGRSREALAELASRHPGVGLIADVDVTQPDTLFRMAQQARCVCAR